MRLEKNGLDLLRNAVEIMESGFSSLPEHSPAYDWSAIETVLNETAERLQVNI